MAKTTLAQAAHYLKHAIFNWYANAEIDFGVTGHFVEVHEDRHNLKIIWEENGGKLITSIPYFEDYSPEQLYYIWQESDWEDLENV